MAVILLLVCVSMLVATGFLLAFLWAVKSGQMDDDYTPSLRMLFDDKPPEEETDFNADHQQIKKT